MKKVFTSIILFAAASLLFYSCSSSPGVAITKRHYRNGYYVERNHARPIEPGVQQANGLKDEKTVRPLSLSAQTVRQENSEQAISVKNNNRKDNPEKLKRHIHSIPSVLIDTDNSSNVNEGVSKSPIGNTSAFSETKEMAKSSS